MSVLWLFLYILQNCNAQAINATTHERDLTTISELATESAWSFLSTLDTIHYVLLVFALIICCCICIILSEDYEDYDEYDEFDSNEAKNVRRTVSYQSCSRHSSKKKRKRRKKAQKAKMKLLKAYTAAVSHAPSSNKSISSFPSLLSLPASANPFSIEHYLNKSLSINPEMDESLCSLSGATASHGDLGGDVTDFEPQESRTITKRNDMFIPPIVIPNVQISQDTCTLTIQPSNVQLPPSPTLNSITTSQSQYTDDSLFDLDSVLTV
eukprot:195731_1